MFPFESKFIKTNVTAVKILKGYYLVGIGGYIHVFDSASKKFLGKVNALDDQQIFGIIPDVREHKILVYGGRLIKVITKHKHFCEVNEFVFKAFYEWIHAAKWIEDNRQIATVSISNRLQIWNNALELLKEIICEEKCNLYSAFIYGNLFNELRIISGTAFNEVLVWRPEQGTLKRFQKHNGVIFSIHCNETTGHTCSASDDRSSVLWTPLTLELIEENFQDNVVSHVYGHFSRVFKCHVLKDCFLTAGEDSVLNIWSYNGNLIRKIETHHGGPIWALDANKNDNIIITGACDGGVTLFPIENVFREQTLSVPNSEVPKIIGLLSSSNLVVLCESGSLYLYTTKQKWVEITKHDDLKKYALLTVSKCKNMVALAGFYGQIYLYKQDNDDLHEVISWKTPNKSRIFALHWISCKMFLICQEKGKLTLCLIKNDAVVPVSQFILPPSNERWSTAAVVIERNLVIGDRKGFLHLFEFGKIESVQTLKKIHNHLGVTNLIVKNNEIISLGRNARINIFKLKNSKLQLVSSDKLPFTWLVDIIGELLFAFSGDKLVLWDCTTRRVIFNKPCGGGHRSWDFLKVNDDICISYVKDKVVNTIYFNMKQSSPVDLIEGCHMKEINSVELIRICNNFIIVSGGEDTTLKVSLVNNSNWHALHTLKSHLSSIRIIKKYKILEECNENKETYLIFSGGGRAQIICWKLEVSNTGKVVCTQEYSYYQVIDCEESETRIMDLTITKIENHLLLFAACSDGNIKVFYVITDSSGKYYLKFNRNIFYKLKCILKLCCIKVSFCDVLVTMATDGNLVFWNLSRLFKNDSITFFQSIQSHQSGINSYSYNKINHNLYLFLTGGDDNAIVLNMIKFNDTKTATVLDVFKDTGTHCAQITGVFLTDKYFITASIDQRIVLFKWQILEEKLECKCVASYLTTIADVQGLYCFKNNNFHVFIYGQGIEYIKIKEET